MDYLSEVSKKADGRTGTIKPFFSDPLPLCELVSIHEIPFLKDVIEF